MHVTEDTWHSTDLPRGGVVTIGNYDGIHRGHAALIDRVVERAAELDVPAVLVTFDPHPLAVLRPDDAPPLLTTADQKRRLVEERGIDEMLVIRFDEQFADCSAETFVRDFLVGRLQVQEIYVGSDFRFGDDRRGDVALLEAMGSDLGFAVDGIAPVVSAATPISSTRIRKALRQGEIAAAATMLGRPYELVGEVVEGDRMGKRLGWPTINLDVDNELIPAAGVYATEARLQAYPSSFPAATNIGTRPTVYENYGEVVESHVLDFDADVYGQRVALAFHERLREERIFPSIMELSNQIGRDVEATREYFARRDPLQQVRGGG